MAVEDRQAPLGDSDTTPPSPPDASWQLSTLQSSPPHVTISLPYFNYPDLIYRAVKSILAQTYPNFTLVIVADGPEAYGQLTRVGLPPGISHNDPRIVIFPLNQNRGTFYCHAVTIRAVNSQYFLPHDADDYSSPDRLSSLVTHAALHDLDAVFAPYNIIQLRNRNKTIKQRVINVRDIRFTPPYSPSRPPTQTPLARDSLQHHTTHCALYRRAALLDTAPPHPGFRYGYDTLVVARVMRHLKWSVFPEPQLFVDQTHPVSMSRNPDHGIGTPIRKELRALLESHYRNDTLPPVSQPILRAVQADANRLKKIIRGRELNAYHA